MEPAIEIGIALRLRRDGVRRHGGVGIARAAPAARGRARRALAVQFRHRCGRRAAGAAPACRPRRSAPRSTPPATASGCCIWLNLRLSVAALLGFLVARSRDLRPARRVPSRAGAVAAAPHAPRRPRHRRHHRLALPSVRNPDFACDQDRGHRWRFGIPPVAVFVFEVVLNATSLFNHSNVAMPAGSTASLRLVLVTPDMHRVHHSVERAETQQQFRLQSAVVGPAVSDLPARAAAGHGGMTIGLPVFRDRKELRLDRLLTQPFRSDEARFSSGGSLALGFGLGRRACCARDRP